MELEKYLDQFSESLQTLLQAKELSSQRKLIAATSSLTIQNLKPILIELHSQNRKLQKSLDTLTRDFNELKAKRVEEKDS